MLPGERGISRDSLFADLKWPLTLQSFSPLLVKEREREKKEPIPAAALLGTQLS